MSSEGKSSVQEFIKKLSLTDTGAEAKRMIEVEGKNFTVGQFLDFMDNVLSGESGVVH
ncbi:hypothetical protein GJ688_18545 [Heliobacillus mobilis]|uniref:Uncharacterized protein n=1 Tax=Heliobacterium mobile TaxID=28064 RepID=A0A6I3SPE3_HELMO|nr:hypothetical protein [Heliobacterium mobile]MTV50920.1 hypothetical protein [Heliobacterium mobile]